MAPFAKMNGLGNEIIVADMRGRADRVAPDAAIALNADPAHRVRPDHGDPRSAALDGTADYSRDPQFRRLAGPGLRQRHALRRAGAGRRDGQERCSPSRRAPASSMPRNTPTARSPSTWACRASAGRTFRWPRNSATRAMIELQIGPIDAPVLHSPSAVSMGNPHAIFWVDERRLVLRSRHASGRCWKTIRSFPSAPISRSPRSSRARRDHHAHLGARRGADPGLRLGRLRGRRLRRRAPGAPAAP